MNDLFVRDLTLSRHIIKGAVTSGGGEVTHLSLRRLECMMLRLEWIPGKCFCCLGLIIVLILTVKVRGLIKTGMWEGGSIEVKLAELKTGLKVLKRLKLYKILISPTPTL